MAELAALHDLTNRGVLPYLMEMSTAQILTLDAESYRLVHANKAARDYLQCDIRSIRRARVWDLFPNLPEERSRRFFAALKRRNRPLTGGQIIDADADGRQFSVSFNFHKSTKSSIIVTLRDVTLLAKAVNAASNARNHLSTAIEALSDGFVLYDADDRLVTCNKTYRELYKISAPAMIPGTGFRDILQYGLKHGQYADAIGREAQWLSDRMAAHQKSDIEVEQRLTDGTWLRIVERKTKDGGRVGLRIDVTQFKQQQEELHRIAHTDELTGLRNRRNLTGDLVTLAKSLAPDQHIAVLHIDLDQFKDINGVLGHDAGDYVLQNCAGILAAAGHPPALVARVGGDEFLVAKVVRKDTETHVQDANRLKYRLSQPMTFEGQTCQVGASIGIAFMSLATPDAAADVMTAANIAMAQAKRENISTVVVFEDAMRERTFRNTSLTQDLKKGLANGEFVAHYQPQINARTGQICGFEALIRWERPAGPVPAGEFLSVAQSAGLTEDLDTIVMHDACKATRTLIDWGFAEPRISLNMSMRQIRDRGLVDRLTACMTQYGIGHDNLRIELLESTLLDERTASIIDNVHALIAAGLKVELDDFGTGHAAIATLRKFAVSQIKIDRSLVRDIDRDRELQTITRAIVDLAHNLGISVLAEGVETKAEQEKLLQFQCDAAQGYLHAKPMSLNDLRAYLIDRGEVAAA